MKRLFLVLAALASAALAAHAQQGGPAAAAAPQTTTDGAKAAPSVKKNRKAAVTDYKPRASEYGKKAKCPVEGEEFTVGEGTKAVKYKGKVYYFCCGDCVQTFKKNPAKFAK